MTTDPQNIRKHKRLRKTISVQVSPVGVQTFSSVSLVTTGRTRDLTEGGLGLFLTRQPLAGGDVYISMEIDGYKIKLRGTIRWCKQSEKSGGMFESGIAFKDLSERNKVIIKSFVMHNSILE